MERLNMRDIQDILYRLRKGETERAIARDLRHSRLTIRRYRQLAQEKGYLNHDIPLPSAQELLAHLGPPTPPPALPSSILPYEALVQAWMQQGVEGVAIHQRLQKHHGYTGSYSSVRRFIQRLRPPKTNACVRLETPPGEQAQVDFGTVGRLLDARSGTQRPLYCFVMTLCFSRHQYVEFVFEQSMATFTACHVRAFAFFGGAPRQVVLDNLKAAVLVAAMEDSVLSAVYREMARHYGLLISPCRPRTPQHKGKVESGVHYVQRNFFAAEEFASLAFVNQAALVWVREVAGVRDHGTTREAPLARFAQQEVKALLPLPTQAFQLCDSCRALLHRDCHLLYEGSHYSAPHGLIGKSLDLLVYEKTLQIYEGVTLLTTHPRATRPGERHTRSEHYPPDKARWLAHTPEHSREQASRVGPSCIAVVEHLLALRPVDNRHAAGKLVALVEKVGAVRVEAACARALRYGDPRYRQIKTILQAGLENEPDALLAEVTPPPRPRRSFTHARAASEIFWEELSPC
jgi:transposase